MRGVLAQAGLDQRRLPAPCHPSPLSHRRSGAAAGADSFLYLGRRDDQVKLRGFRIELGEVEAGLRRQAGVQEAAVRLVGEGMTPCWWATWRRKRVTLHRLALRKGLQATLPHYMVPARLILLDALPRPAAASWTERRCPAAINGCLSRR